jgi:hypothetical protein
VVLCKDVVVDAHDSENVSFMDGAAYCGDSYSPSFLYYLRFDEEGTHVLFPRLTLTKKIEQQNLVYIIYN